MAEISLSPHKTDISIGIKSFCFDNNGGKNHINNFLRVLKQKNNKEFNDFVENFQPEIVYCICSTFQTAILAEYISKKMNIPIVVHHFDNVMQTAKLKVLHNFIYNKIQRRMFTGFVISEQMKYQYEKKYGFKYKILMNSIYPNNKPSYRTEKIEKIMYAGGLHLNRAKSLQIVEKCIERINLENDSNVHLEIYTLDMETAKKYFSNNTILNAALPQEELIKKYQDAHILLHVEPFEQEFFDYLKYSLSTKLPEYLNAGKPILCFVPEFTSVHELISKNNLGYAVSTEEEVYKALKDIIKGKAICAEYVNNACEYARQNYSVYDSQCLISEVFEMNINYFEKRRKNM